MEDGVDRNALCAYLWPPGGRSGALLRVDKLGDESVTLGCHGAVAPVWAKPGSEVRLQVQVHGGPLGAVLGGHLTWASGRDAAHRQLRVDLAHLPASGRALHRAMLRMMSCMPTAAVRPYAAAQSKAAAVSAKELEMLPTLPDGIPTEEIDRGALELDDS